MQLPPASVLVTWPRPNYENPPTRGEAGKVVATILTFLVTLVLGIRVYTRRFISKGFGLDDILILIAYFPALAFALCGILAEVYLGWDRHVWDVKLDLLASGLQLSMATYTLFSLASNITKLSTLAMLYRLISPGTTQMKLCVFALAGLIISSTTTFIFIIFFQCSPISDYWTMSVGPQNCISQSAHLLAAGSINTFTDFVVVALPIKTVAGLQLPRKQLCIVIGLFCAGFLACIAGVARTYFTWVMTVNYDNTWHGWAVWVSSAVELYIGILCASIPSIRPFFTAYLPGLIDSSLRSGSTTDDTTHGGKDGGGGSVSRTLAGTPSLPQNNRSSIELLFQRPRGLSDLYQLRAALAAEGPILPLANAARRQTWPELRPASSLGDDEHGGAKGDRSEAPGSRSSRLSLWPTLSSSS